MHNEKGFTLIEMMIVLMIISVLLLITIPNVMQHQGTINEKGCAALVNLIEAQIQAYEIEHNTLPQSLEELQKEGYITTYICPGGGEVQWVNGEVKAPNNNETVPTTP